MAKWYEGAHIWGQTNLTEIDPIECDMNFWKDYWKRTGTQAIIVNAGGIVAYYPSTFKNHYRAAKLGDQDLFGDFVAAAREAGIRVLARMDSNRAVEEFFKAHPDWFVRGEDGSPVITQGRYISCVNTGYYKEYIPAILKEIIERYHPDGFTDNSWMGINRNTICYCETCRKSFRAYSGAAGGSGYELPKAADFSDPVYRKWIEWSYQCRLDNWDLFNKVCAEYGGEDCIWLGMMRGNLAHATRDFHGMREISRRSAGKLIMLDAQGRDGAGFDTNSWTGLMYHQMAGWDTIMPESMATYTRGPQTYRRGASPALETRLWMYSGIAGGITPWWHIVGGNQEDKRIYEIPVPVLEWHRKNEQYLYHRRPVANVAILWNQMNAGFYGGHRVAERVDAAIRGIVMALTRTGIPCLPINTADMAEQLNGAGADIKLAILPELAVLGDDEIKELETFANRGGNIFAIGVVGVMDTDGKLRRTPSLGKLLGIEYHKTDLDAKTAGASWENPVLHNYLRIEEPAHRIFAGFEETATLPMGGTRQEIAAAEGSAQGAAQGTKVLATYIPPYPIYPPEFAWTEVKHTSEPVITEYRNPVGGKAIYAAWDLDSSYGRAAHPDHGDLIGNIAHYLLDNKLPIKVTCDAYIDFKCYWQEASGAGRRLIIHLVNGNHTGFENGYAEKSIPVGPVVITVDTRGIPALKDFQPGSLSVTVDADTTTGILDTTSIVKDDGIFTLTIDKLNVHQLIIIDGI